MDMRSIDSVREHEPSRACWKRIKNGFRLAKGNACSTMTTTARKSDEVSERHCATVSRNFVTTAEMLSSHYDQRFLAKRLHLCGASHSADTSERACTRPEEQLREVVSRHGLADTAEPFTRCIRCNGALRETSSAEVRDRVPSRVAAAFHDFKQCPECSRVYWEGPHMRRMKTLVELALSADQ